MRAFRYSHLIVIQSVWHCWRDETFATRAWRWFPVRTAQSQHPNVYKHKFSLDGMRIDVIRYEPHTLSSKPFRFFFQEFHWFLQLRSCFIKWYKKVRCKKLCIHVGGQVGGCFETLNLLHVSSCEMFTFCDVLHETKQKSQTNSWECAGRTGIILRGFSIIV